MNRSALRAWWRFLRTAILAGGLLLSFLAVVEILRVYAILRDVHPWLGLGFLSLLAAGSVWILARFLVAFWSLPRAPSPPEIEDPTDPSPDDLLAWGRFLHHRMQQVRDNPRLSSSDRESLEVVSARLSAALRNAVDAQTIGEAQATLARILGPIDQLAERTVQDCVRDVMLGVVLSPYRSVDLLLVLYRNGRMVLQLAQLYQTRPALMEQVRIVRDVVAIVATVNFLNFTEKFVEQLLERLPVIGQVAGDVTQGIGAGLLTSAAGHTALDRCRSIGAWDRQGAQERLAQRMSRFARDVKVIFQADVLPKFRPRLPEFSAASERVSAAFDGAVEGMHNWLWRPVTKRGVAFAGATWRGGGAAWRGMRTGSKGIVRRGTGLLARGKTGLGRLMDRAVRVFRSGARKAGGVRRGRGRRDGPEDGT